MSSAGLELLLKKCVEGKEYRHSAQENLERKKSLSKIPEVCCQWFSTYLTKKRKFPTLTGLAVSRLLPREVNRTLSSQLHLIWTFFFFQVNICNFNAVPLLPLLSLNWTDWQYCLGWRRLHSNKPGKPAPSSQLASLWPLGGLGEYLVTGDLAVILGCSWTEKRSSFALWAPQSVRISADRSAPLNESSTLGIFLSLFRKWRAEPWDSFCSDDINKLQRKSSQTFPCCFCSPN